MLSNRKLLIAAGLYLLSVIAFLPALIRSGYIKVIGSDFFLLVLLYLLLILGVHFGSGKISSVFTAAAAGSLSAANTAQALMYYACCDDSTAVEKMNRIMQIGFIHVCVICVCWIALWILGRMMHGKGGAVAELIICGLVCTALSAAVFVFGGKNSNTSAIAGIQPAIIMAFLIIFCLSISLGRQFPLSRLLHWVFAAVMLGVLILRHELGLPIFCGLAFLLYYLLLYPTPKWMTLFANAVVLLCTVAVMCMRADWLNDTLNKLTSRGVSAESAQVISAQDTLRTSGIFGSFSYDVYVPAASSDFALANIVHYAGFVWLVITAALFLIGLIGVIYEETEPHGFSPATILRGMCAILFLIMNVYNLAMSLKLFPLIGCQALFCGTSYGYAILSALILGCITYNEEKYAGASDTAENGEMQAESAQSTIGGQS